MKAPCKDCEERAPKCHGSCPKYKAFRAELEKIRKEKQKGYQADSLRAEAVVRLKWKYRKEHTG